MALGREENELDIPRTRLREIIAENMKLKMILEKVLQQDESRFDLDLRRDAARSASLDDFDFGSLQARSRRRRYKDITDVLDQIEGDLIQKREDKVRLEILGEAKERIWDEIALSAAKVKSDFEKVKIMLNCLNPEFVNNQVAEPGSSSPRFPVLLESIKERQPYQKAKSEIPNRLRYCKDEIKTTAELLEKMFQEIDENVGFTKSSGYEKLREFNHYLLDHIEKCDTESIAKIAESSVAKVEPQSKGVVSKKNALRRQHNSQRDDPDEELSRDQAEMKATLVECVFRIPQQPRFITALGYTPILVA